MIKIRWRDNGILFGSLGCLAITAVFSSEFYIQGLSIQNDAETVIVAIENELGNNESFESIATLSEPEVEQIDDIVIQLTELSEQGVALDRQRLDQDFPNTSANVWLAVGKSLCKHRRYEDCKSIYQQLLDADSNIENDVTQEVVFQLAKLSTQLEDDERAVQHYQELLEANPNHQASLINLALALARNNLHQQAVTVADQAIDSSSGDRKAKALSIKASSLMVLQDSANAEQVFQKSIQYRPQHAATWHKLAGAMMANNREHEIVLQTLSQATSLQPNLEEALYDRARYYWKIGELEKSRSDLETASEVVPDFLPARWTLIHLYVALEKKRSQKEIDSLKNLGLSDVEVQMISAIEKLINSNYEGAINEFETLLQTSENPWLVYHYVSAKSHIKKDGEASALIKKLTPIFDDYWLGEISQLKAAEIYWQEKEYEPALELLTGLHNAYPNSALFAERLGDLYFDQDLPEQAIPILQHAITLTEDNRHSRFRLARAYSRNQQIVQAIEAYSNYLEDYPSNKTAHYNLATLLKRQDQTQEAVEQYQQAIEIDPSYTNAQYQLSLIFKKQQRFEEAMVLLDELLAENPNHHKVRQHKIEVLYQQQQFAAALEEAERLLALEPNRRSTILIKSDLQRDLGDLQQSADTLINLNPDDLAGRAVTKLYNIGVRALHAQDLALAEQCFENVLSVDPLNHKAIVNLTVTYNRGNNFEQTVTMVSEHKELLELNHKISINLAAAHDELGNYREVTELLQPLEGKYEFSKAVEKMYRKSQTLTVANEDH